MDYKELRKLAIDQVPCGLCGATAGTRCTTTSGRPAQAQHESRLAPIRQAAYLGFEAGVRDAVSDPKWAARFASPLR